MPTTESDPASEIPARSWFVTTRWSVVLSAKDRTSPDSAQALEKLCRTYWYPLYAFARGAGHAPADAQDLTQEFFARFLAKDYLKVVAPEKGRFRTFLRLAFKRFLIHEWARLRAQKRGGGGAEAAFDAMSAEQRFQAENRSEVAPPDRLYDQRWAVALLREAVARIEGDYRASGREAEWCCLKPHLTAERGAIPYPEIALALGTTEGAARVAVHRLRRRFREVFRQMVADTVSGPGEVEEELREVLGALRG